MTPNTDAVAARLVEMIVLVSNLRYDADNLSRSIFGDSRRLGARMSEAATAIESLLAELAAARARVTSAAEVIAPFTTIQIKTEPHDDQPVLEGGPVNSPIFRLTCGHFRKAAQWLADREGRSDG